MGCKVFYLFEIVGCYFYWRYFLFIVIFFSYLTYVVFHGSKGDGNNLEVMILRNCSRLKKVRIFLLFLFFKITFLSIFHPYPLTHASWPHGQVEVKKLMKALLAGKFRLLRHLVRLFFFF